MKGGGKRKSEANGSGVHDNNNNSNNKDQMEEARREGETLVSVNANANGNGPHIQPPNLDDGFYEIEAIRRKRMRKGQLQYLIKWRGWPETANTWEPLDNLQSVPDVIDAFEDGLSSGKQQRRRKRKHVVHHTLPKKRHQRSTTTYSLRRFPTNTSATTTPPTDNHPQSDSAPLSASDPDPPTHPQTVFFPDDGETDGNASSLGRAQQPTQNGFANASNHIVESNEENDYDPKLSELRATTNNGVDVDHPAIHVQQAYTSAANGHPPDGDSKVNSMDPVQSDRSRGAKRRKSGSVKRFKCPPEPVDTKKASSMSAVTVEPCHTGPPGGLGGNNSHGKNGNAGNIVKIIKPIGYSATLSGNAQDILLTLIALRSDGAEVMVDNKYLKEHNPLLLINYYEQHLRYIPVTEHV